MTVNPVDTLRAELANALHEDWCGCDSWDGANCEDYHEGEFPESADAALAVVVPVLERQAGEIADHWRAADVDEGTKAELTEKNISLRAEGARLAAIATAAEYHTGPEECCDSECDHLYDDEGNFIGTDGEWCPHVEMRHATAEDAIEAHKVPLLEARIETLDREAAEDAQFREAVAAALKVSPILFNAGLVSAIERLTRERDEALADAAGNEATLDTVTRRLAEALNLDEVPLDEMLLMVGNIVDERHGSVIRSAVAALESAPEQALASRPAIPVDAVVLPDNWETQIRQALHARAYDISEAGPLPGTSSHDRDADRCADEIAGDVVVLVNDWMSAPVSGSDTTAQPEPRTWTADDLEPPGDVRQVSAANSQVFTRRTFWQPGVGALLPWGVVAKRTGVLTEVVPSGGDTDTTEVPGE